MSGAERDDAMRAAAREVLRELLVDLRQTGEADVTGTGNGNGNGNTHTNGAANGHSNDDAVIPMVPAPPVAAVLRPSTWSGPAAPGEIIGEPASIQPGEPRPPSPGPRPSEGLGAGAEPAPRLAHSPGTRVEPVTIASDDDLDRFVRALVARVESPRDRLAIRSGRLRFVLRNPGAAVPPAAHRAGTATGTPRATATPHAGPPAEVRVAKGPVTERVVREAAVRGGRLLVARGAVVTPLARDCARAMDVEIEKERTC